MGHLPGPIPIPDPILYGKRVLQLVTPVPRADGVAEMVSGLSFRLNVDLYFHKSDPDALRVGTVKRCVDQQSHDLVWHLMISWIPVRLCHHTCTGFKGHVCLGPFFQKM